VKILVFNWKDLRNPDAGGAEVFCHEVARRWVEWGNEVTLFARAFEGSASEERIAGIDILRRGGKFSVYRQARRWYTQKGRGRYDVILDSVNTRPFLTPDYVSDTPVVALIYQLCADIWPYEFPRPMAMLGQHYLEPRWLRHYRDTPTITISESSRKDLTGMGIKNVSIVPIGATLPQQTPDIRKERVPTLIFVGRLARNKRPDHAIETFRHLLERIPEARLWVVGSGPMENELHRAAPPQVKFFGRVSQSKKFELMARAHLLIATSVREGWGLIVTEAAAVGTPSVGYNVAGLRDSLGALGAPVVFAGSPKALAEAAAKVLAEYVPPSPVLPISWSTTAEACLGHLLAAVGARESSGQ